MDWRRNRMERTQWGPFKCRRRSIFPRMKRLISFLVIHYQIEHFFLSYFDFSLQPVHSTSNGPALIQSDKTFKTKWSQNKTPESMLTMRKLVLLAWRDLLVPKVSPMCWKRMHCLCDALNSEIIKSINTMLIDQREIR